MQKLYIPLFICFFVFGCEVRLRDSGSGSGLISSSADSDSSLFSISRSDDPVAITGSTSSTTIESQVISPPQPASMYEIVTPAGNMTVRLFNETPAHRDNFKKLVEEGFYDGTTFHRVMANFIIQGGDPNSRDNDPKNDGMGGPGYNTNAEFSPALYHKKGALAAARQPDQVNPQRRSSGSQFYIVVGRPYNEQELAEVERYIGIQIRNPNFAFSNEARNAYTSVGGAPTLDMQYTVFGELVDGFDVLDRISSVATDTGDRPKDNIPMSIRAIPAQ